MREWKILFVGLGSIAKRHIKNLVLIQEEENVKYRIDVFRSGIHRDVCCDVEQYIENEYYIYEDVPLNYDIVFITNPTEYHLETLQKFHTNGKHFFIEKPLCNIAQMQDLNYGLLRKNSICYVACPLRYTDVIQYLKKNIDFEDVFSIRCISSSYLPEWRKDADYRKCYSAHREMGGGVSIDLIHEWDYLSYLLGQPQKVSCYINKVSDLEIDSDDIAIYIAQYDGLTVELHLDYFGRVPIRQIQLFMKADTVFCDLIESTITFLRTGEKIEFGQERDDYQKEELRAFLNMVQGKEKNINDMKHACEVLKLTKGIL